MRTYYKIMSSGQALACALGALATAILFTTVAPKPLTQEQATTPYLEGESAAYAAYGPHSACCEALVENQEAMLRALQAQTIAEQETQRLLLHFSGSHGQEME